MMEVSQIEEKIIRICDKIILSLRGTTGVDGNTLIERPLIDDLYNFLELYKNEIKNKSEVSKEVVSVLWYTCTRFFNQSKYSKNSAELLHEFERMHVKLIMTFQA